VKSIEELPINGRASRIIRHADPDRAD